MKTIQNTYTLADYSVVTDSADFKSKRIALAINLKREGRNFEAFVKASVIYFYSAGNKRIDIVNKLLRMAYMTRGMNASRLAVYLEKMIPHDMTKVTKHSEFPQFTTKLEGKEYLTSEELSAFLMKYPQWSKYGRVSTPSDYKFAEVAKSFVANAKKHGKTSNDIIKEITDLALAG